MPHLVARLSPAIHAHDGQLTLALCDELVRKAHAMLAARGAAAISEAASAAGAADWGSRMKRARVTLPPVPEERPVLLRKAAESHSLVEVVNQCATMERLLDGLRWAMTEQTLVGWTVQTCHPTTSSGVGSKEHDLELVGPDGALAWFEVSDVASELDGNRKEEGDLRSLGLLGDGKGDARFPVQWPTARCFLIVAREFAGKLRSRRWKHLRYVSAIAGDRTIVMEALPQS